METQHKALAIVYRKYEGEFEFLALRNNPADKHHGGDFWYVVTGGVEEGEQPAEAAVRELFEETGITNIVNIVDLQRTWEWVFQFDGKDTNCIEYGFLIEVDDEVCQLNEEHIDYTWLRKDEFVGLINWENKQELVEILQTIM
jgi:dihydroneopterin triphosphate diphosphatase